MVKLWVLFLKQQIALALFQPKDVAYEAEEEVPDTKT
jgi:hypothetical protein